MKKTVSQLIIDGRDKTAKAFDSVINRIKRTGKRAKDEGEASVKLSKKLEQEQKKLDLSTEQLSNAERQLADAYKKIARDAKNATTEEQKIRVERARMAAASKSLSLDQRELTLEQRKAAFAAKVQAGEQSKLKKTFKDASKEAGGFSQSIKRAGLLLVSFFAVRKSIDFVKGLIQTADSFKLVQARITLATDGLGNYLKANASLFLIAQKTRSNFADIADLFSQVNKAVRRLGFSQQVTLKFIETVGKANKIAGISAVQSSQFLRQLTQALQSGVLRGDEFNTMMETSPRLAEAMAKGLGVPVEALREMAAEGKLTAQRVIESINSQQKAIDTEFGKVPKTVEDVLTQIKNIWSRGIGELDQKVNFSNRIVAQLERVKTAFSAFLGVINRNADTISTVFDNVGRVVGFVSSLIGGFISTLFGYFLTVKNFFGLILGAIQIAYDKIKSTVGSFDGIGIKEIFDGIAIAFKLMSKAVGLDALSLKDVLLFLVNSFVLAGNAIRGAFNVVTSAISISLKIIIDALGIASSAMARFTHGKTSRMWAEFASDFALTSVRLKKSIEDDTRDIVDSYENAVKSFDKDLSAEAEVKAIIDKQKAIKEAKEATEAIQQSIKPITVPVIFVSKDGKSFSDSRQSVDDIQKEALRSGRRQ